MLDEGQWLRDRYQILGELGRGGMGEVFRALDKETAAEVAIKCTDLSHWGPAQQDALRDQFRREAQTLLRLSHANLPRFLDFWEEEWQAYLVMELVPGCNLAQHVQEKGPLDEATLLVYLQRITAVLHYLHSQEPPVIFRDLKPSNMMLSPDGDLKLIDFGLAKSNPLPAQQETHSSARGLVSPGFAAPEQYSGGTDARSDLYSLGATAYFLATGVTPPDSVDRATSGETLKMPDQINPELSSSTALLITRLMQLKRDRRPGSAQEVLVQLRARMGAEVATAAVVPRPRRRPAKKWWVLGGLVGSSALAAAIYAGWPRPSMPLHLESSPPGATVKVDDRVAGITPCYLSIDDRTKVRLELQGHYPVLDQPGKFASGPLSLFLLLRPGLASPGMRDDQLPGYYPPGLGGPPRWLVPHRSIQVSGHAVGIPSDWAVVSSQPTRLEIQQGDGVSSPRRTASLEASKIPLSDSLWEAEVQALKGDWMAVRILKQSHITLAYWESRRGALTGRRAWMACEKADQTLVFRLEMSPCPNVYHFIRDLDMLRTLFDLESSS